MKQFTKLKLATLISASIALSACNGSSKEEAVQINLEDEQLKTAYAIGVTSGENMRKNIEGLDGTGLTVDIDALLVGYEDGMKNASKVEEQELQQLMNGFRERVNTAMQEKRQLEQEKQAEEAKVNVEKGKAFLEENKAKEGVVALESGLQYKIISEGSGDKPTTEDRVKVHYTGTLIDGTTFDSSVERGEPAEFGVTQVIKGWTEGLQLMKEGAKYQFFIPSDLAYGPSPRPKIPGNSVLIFEVELLDVIDKEEAAPTAAPAAKK